MKIVITGLLILCVSACGWHLRGSTAGGDKLAMTTPLDLVIVTADDHTPLLDAVRQALPNYKINELKRATTNSLSLLLGQEIMDKRTAGVGSDALTSAYEIILSIDYSLSNANGVITPLNTKASISRTYDYNVNNANSATQEEELVMQEMRRELAQAILRRAKSLGLKAPAVSPAPTTK
jgi:LPS-assembly lipoprotein